MPKAVLTRPAGRNETLAAALAAQGFSSLVLPALELLPLDLSGERWQDPADYDLLMFVSGNAAAFYFSALGERGRRWPEGVRLAAVGAATARALLAQPGVPPSAVIQPRDPASLQDSEALWPEIEPLLGQLRRVLIVRGQTGREWLGERLEQAGVQVQRLAVYRRCPTVWNEDQARLVRQALDEPMAVLLSSSESVDAVLANVQRLDMIERWAAACRYVVIHPRIQERLQSRLDQAGIAGRPVVQRCTPDDGAIVAAMTAALSRD
ncbi:uroporphyrinogen-III synthase [Alcaligenes sp. WGS1538]|uniref:uroporphyrinogen-III synthase n=1 Tax=Alcaligenes sp. WGS1538 TaxID=3366811 RepID=UPI00372D073B